MNQPIPASKQEKASYRIYTDEEIKTFVNHDKLPKPLIKDVLRHYLKVKKDVFIDC